MSLTPALFLYQPIICQRGEAEGTYNMAGAILLIIVGILVWLALPRYFSGKKRSKDRKQKELICKIIGWLLIFLGVYDAISILFGF